MLLSNIDGHTIPVTLHDVMYAPSALSCLMSVSKVDEQGSLVTFNHGSVSISLADSTKVAQGKLAQKVYLLSVKAKFTGEHVDAVTEMK